MRKFIAEDQNSTDEVPPQPEAEIVFDPIRGVELQDDAFRKALLAMDERTVQSPM